MKESFFNETKCQRGGWQLVKTVIIADDHPFSAEGLSQALQSVPNIHVVGIVKNGIDAISEIKRKKPHGALLDLSMPGANGLEVFLEAQRWSPNTRFAIITGRSASPLFNKIMSSGIHGLFVKNEAPEEICTGIITMLQGERFISPEAQSLIAKTKENTELSKREYQVLQGLARGQSNRELAEILGLSPKTIDTHRTNLLRKMDVTSTASLLVSAMRKGMIDI